MKVTLRRLQRIIREEARRASASLHERRLFIESEPEFGGLLQVFHALEDKGFSPDEIFRAVSKHAQERDLDEGALCGPHSLPEEWWEEGTDEEAAHCEKIERELELNGMRLADETEPGRWVNVFPDITSGEKVWAIENDWTSQAMLGEGRKTSVQSEPEFGDMIDAFITLTGKGFSLLEITQALEQIESAKSNWA